MEHSIETRGLSKTYRGNVQALKSLDLQVPVGCCFGLLGPNGAGKSTLVKTLLSIVSPTSGDAQLMGRDIRETDARRGVGYLPEGHHFPRYLTGFGLCSYFGKLAGLGGSDLNREIREKLALVGMGGRWEKTKISKYSKGMMQRVGLAQALLGEPKIIFLDEPTDGVDPVGRKELRDVIRNIAAQGTTVFLNSHLLSEVELMCDYVGIMHQGQLLRLGKTEEIKDSLSDKESLTVRFLTTEVSSDAWKPLEAKGAKVMGQGWFEIGITGRTEITPIVDGLRSHGIEIHAIQPETKDLETAFIELIQEQENQGVGAQAGDN